MVDSSKIIPRLNTVPSFVIAETSNMTTYHLNEKDDIEAPSEEREQQAPQDVNASPTNERIGSRTILAIIIPLPFPSPLNVTSGLINSSGLSLRVRSGPPVLYPAHLCYPPDSG